VKIWEQIELGCYCKDDRAEQQIDSQNVHLHALAKRSR
jgi:hypothetical protein